MKLSANLQETNLISGLHFKVNDSASWPQAAERSDLKLNINELINHHKQFIVLSVINVLSVMHYLPLPIKQIQTGCTRNLFS